jgi:hypothetical protein
MAYKNRFAHITPLVLLKVASRLETDSTDAPQPFPRTFDGHEYVAGYCHTAEVLYLSHQVVSCRIIVHVLHRLAGSAVMIVQCGTTTNAMHAFGGKALLVS